MAITDLMSACRVVVSDELHWRNAHRNALLTQSGNQQITRGEVKGGDAF